jgi:uncharacterized membrane protein YgcG
MKITTSILSIALLILMASAVQAASVITATNAQDAAALVYVSGYDMEPQVFYPYETGTITVHVTNAANASVGISQPDLIDPNIHVLNHASFSTMTNIGPGATVDYSFLVTVDPPDGTYFPIFTVSPKIGNAIHSTLKVKVDSTDIRASIAKKPDSFSISKTDTVNVSIVNPRDGDISDLLIVPAGTVANVSPSESYVGTLAAGNAVQVPFQVTPDREGTVTFHITFNNGDNRHTLDLALPLTIGVDKTAAVPVINNVALTLQGANYHLTGDVTNAGVTDAKSMVLTVNSPARPVEPYTEYAIGSLASDDFSSFELDFAATDLSAVPVQVRWKDANGNSFASVTTLDLRSIASGSTAAGSRTGSSAASNAAGGSFAGRTGGAPGGGGVFSFGGSRSSGGLSAFYLPIGLGVLVIIAVVLWMKRKWITAKLKKR